MNYEKKQGEQKSTIKLNENFSAELSFYEKLTMILGLPKTKILKETEYTIYFALKSCLNSSELLKLRSKIHFISLEKIKTKEYMISLDNETKKIIKKIKRNSKLMEQLNEILLQEENYDN